MPFLCRFKFGPRRFHAGVAAKVPEFAFNTHLVGVIPLGAAVLQWLTFSAHKTVNAELRCLTC